MSYLPLPKPVLFLILFLGIVGTLLVRAWYIQTRPQFVAASPSLTLIPPKTALTGILQKSEGEVVHFTREADDFAPATPSGIIRQGETLATKNGSATVTLDQVGTIDLLDATEISFVNLVPPTLVFRHKSGSATYTMSTPVSVRVGATLLSFEGSAILTMDSDTITVGIKEGSGKVALVDTENTTNVMDIPSGSRAIIDREAQTITLR